MMSFKNSKEKGKTTPPQNHIFQLQNPNYRKGANCFSAFEIGFYFVRMRFTNV